MKKWFIKTSTVLIFISGCGEKKEFNHQATFVEDTLKEPLMKVNKKISENERRDIDLFVKRKGWPMIETGTGLLYSVYKEGTGAKIESGDMVVVDFEITLLNGKICYTSEETGAEEFVVDHDHIESGLHEAMKYLRVGDQAKIIIPSHLAFGLAGDMDQIPPLSPIVYDLELLEKISKKK